MNAPTHRPVHATETLSPISILACGGSLPLEIAQNLRRRGRPLNIVCIAGMADADFTGFDVTTVGIGRIGALLQALSTGGAREMVIAGHARRPDLRRLTIDLGFVRHLLTILSLMRGGDDHVLRRIATFFGSAGLTVKSIAEVAPELLTPPGLLTSVPSMSGSGEPQADGSYPASATAAAAPATVAGATLGWRVIRELGPFDVGQAVIVEEGRVAAIEGAEGTAGLLSRLPSGTTGPRILVKAAKPQQDLRIDLPAVGPETVDQCAAAAVETIALETGRSLIVSRAATIEKARGYGISLIGLTDAREPAQPVIPRAARVQPHLVSLARAEPARQDRRDAVKGLRLLTTLGRSTNVHAAVVARENILALNIDEPLSDFVERSGHLLQWGDRLGKGRPNRTLVLASACDRIEEELLSRLRASKIAGLAFLAIAPDSAAIDLMIKRANDYNLFLLSLE